MPADQISPRGAGRELSIIGAHSRLKPSSATVENTQSPRDASEAHVATGVLMVVFATIVGAYVVIPLWKNLLPEESALIEPLAMKLDYTDSENVRVYEALFSDTDTLEVRVSGERLGPHEPVVLPEVVRCISG